jgi:hypothetical protein
MWEVSIENLIGVLDSARETMFTAGFLDRTYFAEGIARLREWSRRPDAAMWFAISWAEGVRPV